MRKVLVTTLHRGVFFGTLDSQDGDKATLIEARNIVYWSAATKGFLGLAATGPAPGSRVGPAVPRLELAGVTSVTDCTPAAIAAMEAGPWS